MKRPSYTLRPIGVIHTPYTEKSRTPRQPGAQGEQTIGRVVLHPGMNFEQALKDLEGFERIWLVTWFDRVSGWKPRVLPPRERTKRGLFATRSPHRPNPLGISLVRLLGVKGRELTVENPDLLDGTPVLDIKPYVPGVEAFPESRAGWLDALKGEASYEVEISPLAAEQIAWLRLEHQIELEERLRSVLCRDPFPHPYRRIKAAPGGYQLSIKSWRVLYTVVPAPGGRSKSSGGRITIVRIESGFPPSTFTGPADSRQQLPDGEAHRSFHQRGSKSPGY